MKQVSVTIPAYNEGERLPPYLHALVEEAPQTAAPAVELIVVDDGSAPEHVEKERQAVLDCAQVLDDRASPHRVRFAQAPRNGGKGAAIRLGWRESNPSADWLGFVDADGAICAREFWRVATLLEDERKHAMVAGSRVKMAGKHIDRHVLRHLQGRVFATWAETMLKLDFYDTQCGFKFFRADMLRPMIDSLQENRWLLDIELILAIRSQGGLCREEPIDWADIAGSKITPAIDAIKMGAGIVQIRRRWASGLPTRPST